MKNKDLRSVVVLVASAVVFLAAGCSESPPCNTDPSQVEGARAELRSAEQQVESVQGELTQARQQKTNLENQMNTLPDPSELAARLEELKKGSGR